MNETPINLTKKQSIIKRLEVWVSTHKRASAIIAIIAVLILTTTGAVAYLLLKPKPQQSVEQPAPIAKQPEPEPEPIKYYAPLTGRQLSTEAETKKAITAIMIENSPSARPQSGMQQAEITYEAIAEGGITRFLNLYQQNKPGLIGPVRSLRPYYVDWLAPWQASVAHVGGSKRSLDEVRNGNYRDIDQFFNANTYWRARDRYAPHNVYTSFENLDALNNAKGYTESNPPAIKRDPSSKKSEAPDAKSINVTMSSRLYNSSWAYNAEANNYSRSQADAPHTDREDGQITADVVIVLKMQMNLISEDGWRENYNSSGEGGAVVFQNGTAHELTWRKPTTADQLTFIDSAGKEFLLAPGKLWISAIPANKNGQVVWE